MSDGIAESSAGQAGVSASNLTAARRAFWVDPDVDPRNLAENPVGETETLAHYLEHYRTTFEMKCDGHRELRGRGVGVVAPRGGAHARGLRPLRRPG
ncbi:hypothetical protein GCM10009858_18230 [Terrabacter carboxydivorans]|uniref:Uncharacterized protein n=1 Tax=Terrabacter carboxydivorans TaxID=619730 RepID=A0ABP5YGL0_9MICO